MNIKNFIDSEKTFFKVLDILNSHADMSTVGHNFVAGGSVANILYHLIHGGKLVINDIDVYHKRDTKINRNIDHDWYSSVYINEEGLEVLDDHYGRTYVSENGARMRVINHSRNGLFNHIGYGYEEPYHSENKKSREVVILEGFDLNCCKAGLDMVNSKIIYTPEFLEFLKTKQMRVTNPCAPLQTTIRLYKKLKDLDGIFCDLEHELRFLIIASKHLAGNQITKIVGPETKSKYDKLKDFVEKYFVLREPKNDEVPLNIKDKYFEGDKLKPESKIWVYDTVSDFDIVEHTGSINKLKRIWELLYTHKKKSEQDKINKIFYKNVFLGNMKEDTWVREVYSNDVVVSTKPSYYSHRFTNFMLLAKKNYHKCDFSIKHVDFIDKFLEEHYELRYFLKYCDNIKEQYSIMKFIKSLAKKEGDWVIGILENINWSKHNFNGRLTEELILEILEKEKIVNSAELTTKLDLSDFKFKDCVKELITTLELRSEGKKMGHCVGGYSNVIEGGYSRIFHIDCDGIGSTIEINTPEKERWSPKSKKAVKILEVQDGRTSDKCIVYCEDESIQELNKNIIVYRKSQHFGRYPEKGNLEPTETNKIVAKELLKYLNKKHLPENFKIKVAEDFADEKKDSIFV